MIVGGLLKTGLALADQLRRKSITSFCKLESPDDSTTWVAKDGSLVSVIKVDGCYSLIGASETDAIVRRFTLALTPYLSENGFALQVWFGQDPMSSSGMIKRYVGRTRAAAQALGLDFDDLFEERERILPGRMAQEDLYFALWTRGSILSKADRRRADRRQKAASKASPRHAESQWPFDAIPELRVRHQGFVQAVMSELRQLDEGTGVKFRARLMTVRSALAASRASVYPDRASESWIPSLPPFAWSDEEKKQLEQRRKRVQREGGDPTKVSGQPWPRHVENGPADVGLLLWPSISRQLFDGQPKRVEGTEFYEIGRFIWGAVDVDIGPEEEQSFARLLEKVSENTGEGGRLPWRVSFLLEGGGFQALGLRKPIAAILAFASDDNKRFKEAVKELQARRLRGAEAIVRWRATFSTWAPLGEVDLLHSRVATLKRGIEGWGNMQARDMAGDGLAAIMGSSMGLDCASTATPGAPPLSAALKLLPWNRIASPWLHGPILLRTEDGKPWPYNPAASPQKPLSVAAIVAPPGSGKSVWNNTANLGFLLAPQSGGSGRLSKLSYLSIIDIGFSSAGLVSLVQSALPPGRRHEAMFARLRNHRSSAINIFDLQVGCRYPLAHEAAFMKNSLMLLCTVPGEKAYDGMADLVEKGIRAVYRMLDPDEPSSTPHIFSAGTDPLVDEAIAVNRIALPAKAYWRDVVDELCRAGKYREAGLAQRYAVPTLADMVTAVTGDASLRTVGSIKVTATDERLVDAFTRMIGGAISQYPMLANTTAFDIGGARVIALDLEGVVPKPIGAEGARNAQLMYLVARQVVAGHFFLHPDDLVNVPALVKDYHDVRIRELREAAKRLCYDEFHNTQFSVELRQKGIQNFLVEMAIADTRIVRKVNVQLSFISQLESDFPADLLDQCTEQWFLGRGQTEESVEHTVKRVGFNASAARVLGNRLTGPGRHGAPMLVHMGTSDGKLQQFLFNTLGPIELWAFSTTPVDYNIRDRLYAKVGPKKARALLATTFPGGSAEEEVERRKRLRNEGGAASADAQQTVIEEIVDEIAEYGLRSAA